MKPSDREKKLIRWFIAALAFVTIAYTFTESLLAFRNNGSFAALALAVASAILFVVLLVQLRNSNWPQRLR